MENIIQDGAELNQMQTVASFPRHTDQEDEERARPGEQRMGVNSLSQSESTFGQEVLSVEQPSEANPGPPPLTNDYGILRSGTGTSRGNLYSDQNTGQKPPIKSHKGEKK